MITQCRQGRPPCFFVDPSSDGSHLTVCKAMEQRGWKLKRKLQVVAAPDAINSAGRGWMVGGRAASQSIDEALPKWIWALSEKDVDWQAISSNQVVNHFKNTAMLTTKAGLCSTIAELHWWVKRDHRTFFPRCYQLSDQGDRRAFVVDFRRSAAASIIRLHLSLLDAAADVHCAPRLVSLALKAVVSWGRDLMRSQDQDDIRSESENSSSGGVSNSKGVSRTLAEQNEDDQDISSDGISALEWAEVLVYSELLMSVADALDSPLISTDRGPSSSGTSPTLCRGLQQGTLAAISQLGLQIRKKSVQNTTLSKKHAPVYRPPSNGIPSLSEITPTLAQVELPRETRRRQLWSESKPYSTLTIAPAAVGMIGGAPTHGLIHRLCSRALARLVAVWPQAGIANLAFPGGLPRNTWVVKAPGTSRGAGIQPSRSLSLMLGRSAVMGGRVVQKYVENPFLPGTTSPSLRPEGTCVPRAPSLHASIKFDLRQWVLFIGGRRGRGETDELVPAQCFVFEPCYARRCHRKFTLHAQKLKDRLVHLSNYSVQKTLKVATATDLNSSEQTMDDDPENIQDGGDDDLMWTQEELIASAGLNTESWEAIVKPSMRKIAATLAAAVLPSWSDESSTGTKAQCFELLGLDVILDSNLRPWLLEVNMSPGLSRREEKNQTHCRRIDEMLSGIVELTTDIFDESGSRAWATKNTTPPFPGDVGPSIPPGMGVVPAAPALSPVISSSSPLSAVSPLVSERVDSSCSNRNSSGSSSSSSSTTKNNGSDSGGWVLVYEETAATAAATAAAAAAAAAATAGGVATAESRCEVEDQGPRQGGQEQAQRDLYHQRSTRARSENGGSALCVEGTAVSPAQLAAQERVVSARAGVVSLARFGVPTMLSRWRYRQARAEAAATLIQSSARRFKAAKLLLGLRRIRAAVHIQSCVRSVLAQLRVEAARRELVEAQSATTLAAAWRLKAARLKRSRLAAADRMASSLINAHCALRKWTALRRWRRFAEVSVAAIVLQKHARLFLRRCRYLAFISSTKLSLRKKRYGVVIHAWLLRQRQRRRWLTKKRQSAATAVQAQWRCYAKYSQFCSVLTQKTETAAVLTVQRWWRCETDRAAKIQLDKARHARDKRLMLALRKREERRCQEKQQLWREQKERERQIEEFQSRQQQLREIQEKKQRQQQRRHQRTRKICADREGSGDTFRAQNQRDKTLHTPPQISLAQRNHASVSIAKEEKRGIGKDDQHDDLHQAKLSIGTKEKSSFDLEKPSSYLVPDSSFGRRSTGSKKMTLNIGTINAGQISNNNNSNRHHISVEESPPKVQGVLPLPKKSPYTSSSGKKKGRRRKILRHCGDDSTGGVSPPPPPLTLTSPLVVETSVHATTPSAHGGLVFGSDIGVVDRKRLNNFRNKDKSIAAAVESPHLYESPEHRFTSTAVTGSRELMQGLSPAASDPCSPSRDSHTSMAITQHLSRTIDNILLGKHGRIGADGRHLCEEGIVPAKPGSKSFSEGPPIENEGNPTTSRQQKKEVVGKRIHRQIKEVKCEQAEERLLNWENIAAAAITDPLGISTGAISDAIFAPVLTERKAMLAVSAAASAVRYYAEADTRGGESSIASLGGSEWLDDRLRKRRARKHSATKT